MSFDKLLGNELIKSSLKSALKNRFPQSILLIGPDGSGKMTLAKIIAAALLCGDVDSPCGECISCHKAKGGTHPDIKIINEDVTDIKIDTARFLKNDSFILPNDGEHKVYIIRSAQNLNIQAQNVLLKTLEEPPSYAFFILTCENENALLQTVRSRAVTFALSPLSEEQVTSLLWKNFPDADPKIIAACAKASDGIAGKAFSLFEEKQHLPILKNITTNFFGALSKRDEAQMLLSLSAAEKLSRSDFRKLLDNFKLCLHNGMLASSGLADKASPFFAEEAKNLSSFISIKRIFKFYEYIDSLNTKLDVNLSVSLAATCLTAAAYNICFSDNI